MTLSRHSRLMVNNYRFAERKDRLLLREFRFEIEINTVVFQFLLRPYFSARMKLVYYGDCFFFGGNTTDG